jgi:flavin-dependent dehydrogenase
MYDAIVVGARCAGSPTAMLLARRGYRVLLVDRAAFPSDTLSTHILWPHGAEVLRRWGLLDRLIATGLPPICRAMRFDVGPFALTGSVPDANDGQGGYCPRRTVLDHLLVAAAVESGVELRERHVVESLVFEGERVAGIRGQRFEERGRIVIGADGVHSVVARAVGAREYDAGPVLACAYYSYFTDVVQNDIELHVRDRCAFGGAPTHDGGHLVMVNWPAADFAAVRSDIDAHVAAALAQAPDFAARVQAGRRREKWYGAAGVPNYFRTSHGPGWALVGDAGCCKDPMAAQGISDAFLDAESLAEAIDAGFSERADLGEALAAHEKARNQRIGPMYEFTQQLARLEPPPVQMQQLFAALRGNQDATNAFFSAITGAIPLPEFMSPENVGRILAASSEREGDRRAPLSGGRHVHHP